MVQHTSASALGAQAYAQALTDFANREVVATNEQARSGLDACCSCCALCSSVVAGALIAPSSACNLRAGHIH